jgi:hypothetical protein
MISILSSFKPFRGDAAPLQTGSLLNWRSLGEDLEIILYGDEEGVADQARKYGATHIPNILSSPRGVPRFDAIAEHAAANGKFDRQMYLNGDILLPPNFPAFRQAVSLDRYLWLGSGLIWAKTSKGRRV